VDKLNDDDDDDDNGLLLRDRNWLWLKNGTSSWPLSENRCHPLFVSRDRGG